MMEQVTGRTDFLKKISSMTREEITEYMKSKIMRKKLIYPMIILFPKEEENSCHSHALGKVFELDPYSIEVGCRLVLYPIITSDVVSVSNIYHTLVVETCNSFYNFELTGESKID